MRMLSIVLAALLMAAALTAGCGYTTQSQYRPDVATVTVPMWTRGPNVYRRDLEFDLTEALVKRIELDTPYKVVAKQRADTELRGRIKRIEQRVLSRNSDTGRARELEVTFVIEYTWKDLRSGKDLVTRKDFRVAASYIPESPLAEDFSVASGDVVNRLAKRIVETMEADWPQDEGI